MTEEAVPSATGIEARANRKAATNGSMSMAHSSKKIPTVFYNCLSENVNVIQLLKRFTFLSSSIVACSFCCCCSSWALRAVFSAMYAATAFSNSPTRELSSWEEIWGGYFEENHMFLRKTCLRMASDMLRKIFLGSCCPLFRFLKSRLGLI